MERVCSYGVYFVILLCGQLCMSDPSEWKCYSRFDYDEKMLLKMLKIEDEIGKFRHYEDELKSKETALRHYVDQLKSKEEALEGQRKQDHERFLSSMKTIEMYVDDLLSFNSSLKAMEDAFTQIKTNGNPTVTPLAFTVKSPSALVDGYMTFADEITNEGEGYDGKNGTVTCTTPGLYYFSMHILNKNPEEVVTADCNICKNKLTKVRAYTGPNSSTNNKGYYGMSNSVHLRLAIGDVVGLCKCTLISTFDSDTSFSGHLVSRLEQ